MKYILIIIMLLSGCASEQVKVDRATEMVAASNEVVSSTSKLFTQYRQSNMEFVKVFLATNTSCYISPSFVVPIRTGAPGNSTCLSRNEYDKYKRMALSSNGEERGNVYYSNIKLSYDEVLLITTTSLISGLTKYMAAVQEGLDIKGGATEKLLTEAVNNVGAVDSILKNLKSNNIISVDAEAFNIADYQSDVKNLLIYLQGLEVAHRQSDNVDYYMKANSKSVANIISGIDRNIKRMIDNMDLWKSGTDLNKMAFYNNEVNVKNGELKTLKDRLTTLEPIVISQLGGDSVEPSGRPILVAMAAFKDAQENLANMYAKVLNDKNKKDMRDETYRRVTNGLKQAAVIGKILLKASLA